MRLLKSDEPASWDSNVEVVRFAVLDSDGYYMMTEIAKELLAQPAGRKYLAGVLKELRREIIRTRGTRVRPDD